MLPAPNRLRTRHDFQSAIRGCGGTRAGNRLVVVHLRPTDSRTSCPPRVGFVVSKAVGGAVVRNRVKRRLRAIVAGRIAMIPSGADLVVRANPGTATASFDELGAALIPLLDKAIRRVGAAA